MSGSIGPKQCHSAFNWPQPKYVEYNGDPGGNARFGLWTVVWGACPLKVLRLGCTMVADGGVQRVWQLCCGETCPSHVGVQVPSIVESYG